MINENKNYNDNFIKKDMIKLSEIIKSGNSQTVVNKELGKITIDKGDIGKNGYGLLHIIENRKKENRENDEIAAILYFVIQSAKKGKINRKIPKDNPMRIELEKNGIIAILSLKRFNKEERWLLTGFDSNEKKEEATEAIKTVIAVYDRSPEFSDFRKQVGAAASSLNKISQNIDKKSRNRIASR